MEEHPLATIDKNFELCQLYVEKGANPNLTEFHQKSTPLYQAYYKRYFRICQLLLNASSTCNGLGAYAIEDLFSFAKEQEDLKVCKQLIEAMVNHDELDWSHFVSQILEMKHLQNDEVYKQFTLYDACNNQDYQTVKRLLDDDQGLYGKILSGFIQPV